MMWGPTDCNMIAADAHYSAFHLPSDHYECACCKSEFWDDDENDEWDLRHRQSQNDPSLCEMCFDMMGDRE